MTDKIGNLNSKMKIIKKSKMEIPELKAVMTKISNSL